jgi:hypothetical protein
VVEVIGLRTDRICTVYSATKGVRAVISLAALVKEIPWQTDQYWWAKVE